MVTLIGLKHKDYGSGSGCLKEKDMTMRKTVVQEMTRFLFVDPSTGEPFELDCLPKRQALCRIGFNDP